MRLLPLYIGSILLISGCAGITVPKTVQVEVPVSCIQSLPIKPVIHTDSQLAVLNDFDLPIAIRVDELALIDYSDKLTALALPCVK